MKKEKFLFWVGIQKWIFRDFPIVHYMLVAYNEICEKPSFFKKRNFFLPFFSFLYVTEIFFICHRNIFYMLQKYLNINIF